MELTGSWFALAIIAGMTANVFHYINRYLLIDKEQEANANAWFFEFFRLTSFGILALFHFSLQVSFYSLVTLLLLGLVELATVYFYMQMQQITHISISTIILRSRLIWVPIIAFVFLGERLLPVDYMGIFILFLGLGIIAAPKKIFADRGIKISYLTSVSGALGSIFLKAASTIASDPIIMMAMALPSVILFPLRMKNFTQRMKRYLKKKLTIKILAGVANTVSFYTLVLALQIGPVSKVGGIYQAMSMVLVLTGIVFLHERKNVIPKIIGSLITVIGIFVLSLR